VSTRWSFGTILGWAMIGLLLALYGVAGQYGPYVLLVLLLVATPYAIAMRSGRPLIPDLPSAGFLIALGLLIVAASLAARHPSDVLIVVNFGWLLLFIPLQSVLKRIAGPNAATTIARLALAGTALTLGLALFEAIALDADRAGRLMSDPIRIASMAVILGYASLVGVVAETSRRRFIYVLGPILAVGVALLAQTRGAIVSSAAIGAIAMLLLIPNRRTAIIAAIVTLVAAVAAIWVAAQFHIGRTDVLVGAIRQLLTGQPISNPSANIRMTMLQASLPAFAESPWYGHGWQQLIAAVKPYLPLGEEGLLRGQSHLHNDIANFAVAGGVIGLLAYLTIMLTPLIAAWRSVRDTLYRPRLLGVALLTICYAVLGLNAMMFGFEILTSMYVGLSAILLGLCREASPVAAETPVVAADRPPGRVEQATVWVLLALALVVPTILGLITPYAIVLIGLVAWLVLLAAGRLPASYAPLAPKLLLIAFATIAVLFLLSMKAPGDPLFAFNFTMLALCGPLLWLFSRAASEKMPGRVAAMAALGVALTLAMILFQQLTQGGRPRGFNLGPIVLSNAALALAVVATAGTLALRSRLSLLLPLSLAAAIATIILTQSRGPLIAVLPLLLLTGIFLWRVRLRNWLFVAGSGVAVATIAAAAVIFGGGRLARLPEVVMSVFSSDGARDRTTEVRLALYEAAWRAFLDSPWIGHGWARLMKAALPYVDPKYLPAARKLPQLHNDVLNFAVSGGVIGIAVYALIIAAPLIAALRSARDSYWTARVYATAGLAIVYICGGLTDLMFGHEFHTALYVALVAIVLGVFREARPVSPASS
jgi:O-antigen ligase